MTQSKITPEAKARCTAHTLAEQLKQLRLIHDVEVAALAVRQQHDMQDVDLALEADMAWSGQHARLASMRLDGSD